MKGTLRILIIFSLAAFVPALGAVILWLSGSILMSIGVTPVDLVAPFSAGYLLFALIAFYVASLIPALCAGFYFYKHSRKKQRTSIRNVYFVLCLGTIVQGAAITFGSHVYTHGFHYMQNVTLIRDLSLIIYGITASFLLMLAVGKRMVSLSDISFSNENTSNP